MLETSHHQEVVWAFLQSDFYANFNEPDFILGKLTNLKDTNLHTYVSSAHFSRKHQTVLLRAGVQQLTGVDEGVFLHVRLLVEAFATVLAGIGPGVWMNEQVSGEGGGALEHFSTHRTAERPLLKTAGSHGSDKALSQ